ncbi:hypothetical protein E4U21_000821 [Claviceps maximensis]|nr:hypothetical protein E4U21_000821 [Claviceps maximensis]
MNLPLFSLFLFMTNLVLAIRPVKQSQLIIDPTPLGIDLRTGKRVVHTRPYMRLVACYQPNGEDEDFCSFKDNVCYYQLDARIALCA